MTNRSKRLWLSYLLGETITDQLWTAFLFFCFFYVSYLVCLHLINIIDSVWFFKCSPCWFSRSYHVVPTSWGERAEGVHWSNYRAARNQPGVDQERNTRPSPGSVCVHVDWLTVCCLVTVSKHESCWQVKITDLIFVKCCFYTWKNPH